MRIDLASVFVFDQAAALTFYTEVLGFEPRCDIPLGNGDRWLTVGTPGEPVVELLLEPSSHPAVGPFRDALAADEIPATMFAVEDVAAEREAPGYPMSSGSRGPRIGGRNSRGSSSSTSSTLAAILNRSSTMCS